MSKVKVTPFDVADYLTDEEMIRLYLDNVLEDNNPERLYKALGNIAKARGMAQIAKTVGVSQKDLQDSLTGDSTPRFDTVVNILNAIGVQLTTKKPNPVDIEDGQAQFA